jgi:hypothetical protein
MAEMIERVSRAIRDAEDNMANDWLDVARAAIEAMREPTDEMLSAAGTRRPVDDEVMGPDHPWALWDSMTDAALNGNT